jgi:uncharacterized membrane protein (Fun14 family)
MTISGLLGVVVGYAIKKILKIFAILTGLYAVSLMYLSSQGVITFNYDKFSVLLENGFTWLKSSYGQLATFVGSMSIAAPFLIGLAIGFKKG